MATNLTMPRLSDTMTTGKILEWKKKVGDKIEPGDVLAEIESDKATMEFEAFEEGTLLEIRVPAGSSAPIGEVLAVLGELNESTTQETLQSSKQPVKEEIKPAKKETPKQKVPAVKKAIEEVQDITESVKPIVTVLKVETPKIGTTSRIFASPLALRMAAELGVDIQSVRGTGPDGRITRTDIENASANSSSKTTKVPPSIPKKQELIRPETSPMSQRTDQVIEMSQMRSAIARRMSEGWQSPMFTVTMDMKMDNIVTIREQWKGISDSSIPTINDFIICAVSKALAEFPRMNVSFRDYLIIQHNEIHVAFAVALNDGLITPVLFHSDKKSLVQIAQETKILVEKAFSKKLAPEEFSGSTFTISNLGKLEVEHFTAIVNPPEAGILAIGRVRDAVIAVDGEIAIEKRMFVTLSADHRAVDGATGAEFLLVVKKYLENPISLIIG